MERVKPNPAEYPRWIDHEGRRVLVNDQYHHAGLTGIEYDENAKQVIRPVPVPIPEAASAEFVAEPIAPPEEPEEELTADKLFGE